MFNALVSRSILCLTVFLVVAALVACHKDREPLVIKCGTQILGAVEDNCSLISTVNLGRDYEVPVFNPKNTNEFVSVVDGAIVKFNIESFQTQILVDSLKWILTPDWGTTGWIVFSAEWNIWKVREDGTQLTKITAGPRELWPKFNPSGEHFVYPRNMEYGSDELLQNPDLRLDYKLIISDINGHEVDSFCRIVGSDQCFPWTFCAWSPESDQFVARDNGLALYSSSGEKMEQLYKESEASRFAGSEVLDIEWHPTNESIYFQDESGIKYYDLKKGEVNKLRTSCPDEFYGGFSISGDGEHLIALKTEVSFDRTSCTSIRSEHFVLMDISGAHEHRLFFN